MLGHAGLFEFLGVVVVDGGNLLAHETGLFNGELFVGFDLDFLGFLERFLPDEGGHFFELVGDLADVSMLIFLNIS